jgi:hypothetical protein
VSDVPHQLKEAPAFRGCFGISTLFSPINSDVLRLTIFGLSRKCIYITQEENIQDISKKQVEILIEK